MFDSILTMAQSAQDSSYSFVVDAMSIAAVVGMWKMLEKAGEPGWAALIPFYNMYKFCGVVMGNPWYWVRFFVFFIPVIGWIAGIYFLYEMSKATAQAYGKPDSWTWGYLFLSGIFYCITGFDQSDYYGPMGVGDKRSPEARQSRTVSFQVEKNEPERPAETVTEYKEPVVEEIKPQETKNEDVEFIFDQPEE